MAKEGGVEDGEREEEERRRRGWEREAKGTLRSKDTSGVTSSHCLTATHSSQGAMEKGHKEREEGK